MLMTFTMALKKFFGLKSGEGLSEFVAEVRALTPTDRLELTQLLEKELGESIDPESINRQGTVTSPKVV